MPNDKRPILVFGATGRQGGSVAAALMKAQWPVRAIVRDADATAAADLADAGAELVRASLGDSGIIRSAMEGAHGVFSVMPANLSTEDEVRHGMSMADMAADAGIEHFVYSSGASAGDKLTGVPRFDAKPRIEAHIRTLPLTATIVRPMIFMDMLVRPGFGLEEGRLISLVRPDQKMQLIAVEDIGKFVAAIFADRSGFAGTVLKIASDTLTGDQMGADFTEAAGRPITYSRFTDDSLAANTDLAEMAKSMEDGPLSQHADLFSLRRLNPEMRSLRDWLGGNGRKALDHALAIDSKTKPG
ncbi:NAD(P)H-binding protein [Rhizobiales bacterium RZME27]|uniref:NAD(P)H-binding protein n=1 Tax=Endobacterium cereale TaxID=2663029 RepID=A0A6A8AEE4_9HYPH|nr:NmrA/HSCARG family protein [Endobacterium cereale]MEB2846995.1 NmrA/HSCARG family protein [Endobacterium cereale]MQY47586.1 NAD(P)H-binding protein [Endobacterium cereale]